MLALKPYWGKPAVRNFRGGDGNVGIIRNPVRAIVLLDHSRRKLYEQTVILPVPQGQAFQPRVVFERFELFERFERLEQFKSFKA